MEKTKQVRDYKLKEDSLSQKESHWVTNSPEKPEYFIIPKKEINCWKAKFSSQT
jgi:hypothetical protein